MQTIHVQSGHARPALAQATSPKVQKANLILPAVRLMPAANGLEISPITLSMFLFTGSRSLIISGFLVTSTTRASIVARNAVIQAAAL